MELSSSQIEEFEEHGFLFFPELLKSHEVKLLTDHLEGLYSRTGPEVVREKRHTAYDWSMGPMNSANLMGNSRCFPDFCSPFGNYFEARFIFIKAD